MSFAITKSFILQKLSPCVDLIIIYILSRMHEKNQINLLFFQYNRGQFPVSYLLVLFFKQEHSGFPALLTVFDRYLFGTVSNLNFYVILTRNRVIKTEQKLLKIWVENLRSCLFFNKHIPTIISILLAKNSQNVKISFIHPRIGLHKQKQYHTQKNESCLKSH